jgi:uncharacterized OB-fold protein
MTTMSAGETKTRISLRVGMLTGQLSDLASVRLAGCRCSTCRETSFGAADICPNCGRDAVEPVALSDHGVLWSYTVVRHRPPGDYRGPDPFSPFGLGLVELPDGVRILSPIQCDIDQLEIGMELRFQPYLRRDPDADVVAFTFAPAHRRGGDV